MTTIQQHLNINFGFPFPKASVYAFLTTLLVGLALCYTAYDRIREYNLKTFEFFDYLNRQSFWGAGLGIIIISILVLLISEGIILDHHNKRYKAYFRIIGYKFGNWKTLPSEFYINVFEVQHNYSYSYAGNLTGPVTSGATGTYALKDSFFVAYIYEYDNENRIMLVKGSKEKVIERAKIISKDLVCELIINN